MGIFRRIFGGSAARDRSRRERAVATVELHPGFTVAASFDDTTDGRGALAALRECWDAELRAEVERHAVHLHGN